MKSLAAGLICLLLLSDALAAPGVVRLLQAPAWRARGATREPLQVGQELDSSDTVMTGAGARALIGLSEGSLVKLGENAELALKDMQVPAEENGVFKGVLDVLKGAFRFTTTIAGRHREIRAQVRTATIGIRGTDVWGKAEDARDFVVLLEGQISIEHAGHSYPIETANSLFMAPRGQAALPIAPVNPDDLARWAQETEPQVAAGIVNVDGKYRLNLASYPSADGARRLAGELATAGYGATVESTTIAERGWWRVVIAGYASRADAAATAGALREPFHLASPWVAGGR